jgi:glycerophosphoryl diester phosphodiesterase
MTIDRWLPFTRPWVIAHRGASGLLPEHTLPGYALAIEQGADVIEPDLVLSADGVLHARHDLTLARSTDIANRERFADRRRGEPADWWIDDFSSADLAELRAIQPRPGRPTERDGHYRIPSFADVLALLARERQRRDRPLLVYPEIKHPGYFHDRGLSPIEALRRDLLPYGWLGASAPVIVQCFDLPTLVDVKRELGLRTILLSVDLPVLDERVDGYGIAKASVLSDAGLAFIREAHARHQAIHAWTFRNDEPVAGLDAVAEAERAYAAGCDGLFGDFPDALLAARDRWARSC